MGVKKDELYARIAQTRGAPGEFLKIPNELFQAARREEQDEREAQEDVYWNEFSDFIDQNPIGHPRLCGLPGCHGDE